MGNDGEDLSNPGPSFLSQRQYQIDQHDQQSDEETAKGKSGESNEETEESSISDGESPESEAGNEADEEDDDDVDLHGIEPSKAHSAAQQHQPLSNGDDGVTLSEDDNQSISIPRSLPIYSFCVLARVTLFL